MIFGIVRSSNNKSFEQKLRFCFGIIQICSRIRKSSCLRKATHINYEINKELLILGAQRNGNIFGCLYVFVTVKVAHYLLNRILMYEVSIES